MLEINKTTKKLFIVSLIIMIIFAFSLFGFNLANAINLLKANNYSITQGNIASLDVFSTQAFKNTNLVLILCFLFSVVFFIVTADFYVKEKTSHYCHKYVKAKEVTLNAPIALKNDKTIKIRDYENIATLSNTKRVPLLKYAFNDKTTFYYLVEQEHIYVYKEYTDIVKRYIQQEGI